MCGRGYVGPVITPDHALCQSAGERDLRPTWRHLVPIVVPVLASQVVVTDLAAPMLAVHSAICHHDPDRLHPGQLATVGGASWPHPCLPVSTVPDPHRTCS